MYIFIVNFNSLQLFFFLCDGKVIHQNDNINESSASDITEMNKGKSNKVQAKFFKYDWAAYVFLIIIIVVTVLGHPTDEQNDDGTVALQHVWYSGWLTAISTGLGIIPFLFMREPENFWLGISNGKCFVHNYKVNTYLLLCC